MLEIQLLTTGNIANEISDYLLTLGAHAITMMDAEDNPIFEPELDTLPLWPEIKLAAIFSPDQSYEEILLRLYTCDFSAQIKNIQQKIIPDQDWVKQTQALTQPQCFGDNLWIYPSWHEVPQGDGVKILLDPGLAFGTGSHATTALIMTWLAHHPPRNKRVLDYGCGSGILAIAAAKLGASTVWATDIDPQALLATEENAQRNHITSTQLHTCLPPALLQDLKVDVILANILAVPLLTLRETFLSLIKPEGKLILSGILTQQVELLREAYVWPFKLESVENKGEWASMVFIRCPDNV